MSDALTMAIRRARWCSPPVSAPVPQPEPQPEPPPKVPEPVEKPKRDWIQISVVNQLDMIMKEVCAAHGVCRAEVECARRWKPLILARHEFFYRAYTETMRSLTSIARFCQKDHSTVLNGMKRHAERNNLPPARSARRS